MGFAKLRFKNMDFKAELERLNPRAQAEVLSEGLEAGAEIIRKRAAQLAPKKTGAAAAAIGVSNKKVREEGQAAVVVQTSNTGDAFYSYFQDLGWRVGKRPKKGKRVKGQKPVFKKDTREKIPGKHFMEKAAEQKMPDAMNRAISVIHARLDKMGI